MGTGTGVASLLKGDCGIGESGVSRMADPNEIMGVASGDARDSEGPIDGDIAGSMCGDMMIVALLGLEDFLDESEDER